MKFNGRRGTLTYNLEVTGLTLHRIGVNLAHVPSPVGFFHLSYVEEPRPVIAVRHCYSMILRDDVTGYRQYRLGVHAQPCHLQQNWRIKKKRKTLVSTLHLLFPIREKSYSFLRFCKRRKEKRGTVVEDRHRPFLYRNRRSLLAARSRSNHVEKKVAGGKGKVNKSPCCRLRFGAERKNKSERERRKRGVVRMHHPPFPPSNHNQRKL